MACWLIAGATYCLTVRPPLQVTITGKQGAWLWKVEPFPGAKISYFVGTAITLEAAKSRAVAAVKGFATDILEDLKYP